LNKKESTKSWIFILLFMVATAVLAAAWPTLTGGNSNIVPIPSETIYVEIPMLDKEIAAPMAMAAIAAISTIGIVIIGVVITLIFTLIAKFIRKEEESESYAENTATLAANEKERLVVKNKGRVTTKPSDSSLNKWPAWGTAILTLFLVGSLSVMLSRVLWPPTGDVLVDGEIVAKGTLFVLVTLLVTALALFVLFVFLRPKFINNVNETDHDNAPWALFWVALMGLAVVGLGIGYMLYLGTL